MLTLVTYPAGLGAFSLSPFCVKAALLLQTSGQPWQRRDSVDPRKTPHGKLTVEWFLDGNLLTTIWTESGGENIQPPVRSGFGTQLFHMFPKVTVDRDFREDGITVRIQVPLQEEPEGADFS